MKIIIFCFFVFIVIEQLINIVNACTCLPSTIEEKYCRSDWVALVYPLKREEINKIEILTNNVRYTDKLCYQNKNEEEFIYTASQSAACGAFLEEGDKYLIGGIYNKGKTKKINLCGLVESWFNLSEEIKKDLNEGNFGKNCTK
uniref:NTR domain-containing protein n=1 Tax=Meloidogyne hapla TaxID=6305 RepID=A0A1I8BEP9_MELHA